MCLQPQRSNQFLIWWHHHLYNAKLNAHFVNIFCLMMRNLSTADLFLFLRPVYLSSSPNTVPIRLLHGFQVDLLYVHFFLFMSFLYWISPLFPSAVLYSSHSTPSYSIFDCFCGQGFAKEECWDLLKILWKSPGYLCISFPFFVLLVFFCGSLSWSRLRKYLNAWWFMIWSNYIM